MNLSYRMAPNELPGVLRSFKKNKCYYRKTCSRTTVSLLQVLRYSNSKNKRTSELFSRNQIECTNCDSNIPNTQPQNGQMIHLLSQRRSNTRSPNESIVLNSRSLLPTTKNNKDVCMKIKAILSGTFKNSKKFLTFSLCSNKTPAQITYLHASQYPNHYS